MCKLGLCWILSLLRLSPAAAGRPPVVGARARLTAVASLTAEHRLRVPGVSSCGARASLLRGKRDLLGPGIEPAMPELAAGFLSTVPPWKSQHRGLTYVLREMMAIITLVSIHHLILQSKRKKFFLMRRT